MCLKHKIHKIKVVLDNDNKYKNKGYRQGHSMYNDCLKVINENPQCCIYLGEGEHGCLEDLFVEESNPKYKHNKNVKGQWKVNTKAVEQLMSIEEVSMQTKSNFENLFNDLGVPRFNRANC